MVVVVVAVVCVCVCVFYLFGGTRDRATHRTDGARSTAMWVVVTVAMGRWWWRWRWRWRWRRRVRRRRMCVRARPINLPKVCCNGNVDGLHTRWWRGGLWRWWRWGGGGGGGGAWACARFLGSRAREACGGGGGACVCWLHPYCIEPVKGRAIARRIASTAPEQRRGGRRRRWRWGCGGGGGVGGGGGCGCGGSGGGGGVCVCVRVRVCARAPDPPFATAKVCNENVCGLHTRWWRRGKVGGGEVVA